MTDFIQMDIFFFITSVVAFVILFFVVIVGIYVVWIVYKIKKIVKEFEKFALYTTSTGRESLGTIKDKINEILNQGGILERIVATVLGTIIAKTFKSRGKMKKDAPKD
jgi:hypothetical protein